MSRLFSLLLITGLLASYIHFKAPRTVPSSGHYPEALPGAYTGGFGEETCQSCHFDYPLNPEDGSLTVKGIPNRYEPGTIYHILISVEREDLGRAGFQLSSRYADGSQAGTFKADTGRLRFTEVKNTIQYIQHTAQSSQVDSSTVAQWSLEWTAPDSAAGEIIFNIAANAGNGDASPFGDYIYVKEFKAETRQN